MFELRCSRVELFCSESVGGNAFNPAREPPTLKIWRAWTLSNGEATRLTAQVPPLAATSRRGLRP